MDSLAKRIGSWAEVASNVWARRVVVSDPIPELGVEQIDASQIVTPVVVNIPIYTVPAGCYTLKIQTINTTSASFTALSEPCAYRINAVAAMVGSDPIIQPGSEPFFLGVVPGDVLNVIGITGSVGSIQITGMG